MLTQTSETALKALIWLVINNAKEPMSPRQLADKVDASPTYLAKITRMLVKSNILRSHRGALGGVSLSRPPEEVTLLDVVEACQGMIVGNYCSSISRHPAPTCAFHQAMVEVHQATMSVLTRWTLADLAARPAPADEVARQFECKIGLRLPCNDGGACTGASANSTGANGAVTPAPTPRKGS